MNISIAERFRPFCHLPGTLCILPLSKLRFQIFPTYIIVSDMSESDPIKVAEISLSLKGPIEQFTVLQDLEKGILKVWGFSPEGFFRYRIHATVESPGFMIVQEKSPSHGAVDYIPESYCQTLTKIAMPTLERLSFGVTKVADWELVNRRFLLAEILPFWFGLGQCIPQVADHHSGIASLLDEIKISLDKKNSIELSQAFKNLYGIGFESLLNPLLNDVYHKGIAIPKILSHSDSSLLLLTEGSKLIKKMLLSVITSPSSLDKSDLEEKGIEILPCLIPELHSGRLCNVSLENMGTISLEWSKKKIRKMIFASNNTQFISFHFQNNLKTFRLSDLSSNIAIHKNCGESVSLIANHIYCFDHFQQ